MPILNNEKENSASSVETILTIQKASSKLKSHQLDRKKYKGFLILFDIIDSTLRKEDYKTAWHYQTTLLYNVLLDFHNQFRSNAKGKKSDLGRPSIYDTNGFMIKFFGDGCMMFFSIKDVYSDDGLKESTHSLLNEIHNLKLGIDSDESDFKDITLKTVLTYLDDCYQVKTTSGIDYLGKGIDFSFRLEKFGRSIYYVVNSRFVSAISGVVINLNDDGMEINIEGWDCLPLVRFLKGWNDKQLFFVIFKKEMLADSGNDFISPHASDAGPELLKHYVSSQQASAKQNPSLRSALGDDQSDEIQQENENGTN